MKEKACQQMRLTDWFWEALSPNGLSVLLARVLVICCLTRAINGKIIEDEVVYSWVARDVTKNQTKKLSILLSFYFHEVLQHLNTFK